MKKQRLREKTLVDIKKSKQSTFDRLPVKAKLPVETKSDKSIVIFQLQHAVKEDELELSIGFRLLPSTLSFSNLMLELHFDNTKLNTFSISLPPSKILGDELEFPLSLDMKGIAPGSHVIKVELFEKWGTGEKLTNASKYVIVNYVPKRREDRYVKVPIVRKVDGVLRIILPEEKELYQELEKSHRKELTSSRDQW